MKVPQGSAVEVSARLPRNQPEQAAVAASRCVTAPDHKHPKPNMHKTGRKKKTLLLQSD